MHELGYEVYNTLYAIISFNINIRGSTYYRFSSEQQNLPYHIRYTIRYNSKPHQYIAEQATTSKSFEGFPAMF
jgi:hypothetical protein